MRIWIWQGINEGQVWARTHIMRARPTVNGSHGLLRAFPQLKPFQVRIRRKPSVFPSQFNRPCAYFSASSAALADLFSRYGIYQLILDNYYLYHIESPDHMVADIDNYIATGSILDA